MNPIRSTNMLLSIVIAFVSVDSVDATSLSQIQLIEQYEKPNAMSKTYLVKFGDLYPERAEDVRTLMTRTKEKAKSLIQKALDRGDRAEAARLQKAAVEALEEMVTQVNQQYPPTKIKIHGKAVKSDMREALQLLRTEKLKPGGVIHVFLVNNKLQTSVIQPKIYDMPRKTRRTSTATNKPSDGYMEVKEYGFFRDVIGHLPVETRRVKVGK